MAVAGLAIRPERAKKVISDINEINRLYGVVSEVKWATAKPRRKDVYKAYIDILFNLTTTGAAHFHIRFVQMSEYAHNISGPRRYVDTISKQFYQLLLHRPARYYGNKCIIRVRPDKGDCTAHLPQIMNALNNEAKASFRLLFEPFGDVQPRYSEDEPLLQLLDVTIGALAAAKNGTHRDGTLGDYKRELVDYVLAKAAPKTVNKSTPIRERKFSLWTVRPKY